MSHFRNMKYLHDNKIIYRRMPVHDHPSEIYKWGYYYECGTHEYYSMFNSKAKINTFKSLKWHLHTLLYLNQDISPDRFYRLAKYITTPENGFVTFNIDSERLHAIVTEVLDRDMDYAPPNRKRKIVFKDGTGMTTTDKLKIVGSLIGKNKNANPTDIYEIMLYIHDQGRKITLKEVAKLLNVAERTVYRNITVELKNEKDLLNKELNEKLQHR